jgi:hypothetical protein
MNGIPRTTAPYPAMRPLANDPGCPPSIGIPPDLMQSPLADAQAFAALSNVIPPGSQSFMWGGLYFADIAGGQPYHSYLTDLTIPAGYIAVILHVGIGDSFQWSGDLFINGAPHPIIHDFSSVQSTYDEVNPPGASVTTQRIYALATFFDGATPGIGAALNCQSAPFVIDENMNVRVRLRAHLAGAAKRTSFLIWGYYALKPNGIKII